MRWLSLLTIVTAAISVSANSGIFAPDGSVQQVDADNLSAHDEHSFYGNARDHEYGVTNAERLRRGQPLLPPKRRNKLAARAVASPLPSLQGVILVVRESDGVNLGYIRQGFDGQNSYTIGTLSGALRVSIPNYIQNGPGPFEIRAINGPDSSHPSVGAVGGSAGYNFNPGQLGYTYFSGTGHTPANSPPSFSAGHSIQSLGYNAPAESTIWFINSLTLRLSAQWTNVDGSQPSTSLFYDPAVDFVGAIGDFDKFVNTFPNEGAVRVLTLNTKTMTFVPA